MRVYKKIISFTVYKQTYIFFLTGMILFSCTKNHSPKPRGYFRIDFPDKEYVDLDNNCPFTFKYPKYGFIEYVDKKNPYWFNICFPKYKSKIHLTYKPVNNNLSDYTEDIRTIVYKHIAKADDIRDTLIMNEKNNSYGIIYYIKGNTASSVNFYMTDSSDHFLSGSLYFTVKPNKDSLKPSIDFFTKDIIKLVESIQWKKTDAIN